MALDPDLPLDLDLRDVIVAVIIIGFILFAAYDIGLMAA